MKIKPIIKYLIICAVAALLFMAGQAAAFAERGYKAVGGECIVLLLPVLWFIVERNIKDTKAIIKQNDGGGKHEGDAYV